jgi:alpha-glucosidase (family GH31 glycosyl hydrolase)
VKYKLKYLPTGRALETQSMPLDGQQVNGYTQLDTHSLYGTQEVKATHEWFTQQNKRTFIIVRSSFAGVGKFASKWLGDNYSQTAYMGYSVQDIMMMTMFGVPFVGADICGFRDNASAELCTRWTVLGAFYPFSRNHNAWGQSPQEPYSFPGFYEDAISYTDIMSKAIRNKYHIIRYYYTQLYFMSSGWA